MQELTDLIVAAVKHPGFSLVNVFSPCVTFNKINTYDWFKERLVGIDSITDYDRHNKGKVLQHILAHEGLLTGLLYEDEAKKSYEEVSGLAANNQMQSVRTFTKVEFNKLVEDFR